MSFDWLLKPLRRAVLAAFQLDESTKAIDHATAKKIAAEARLVRAQAQQAEARAKAMNRALKETEKLLELAPPGPERDPKALMNVLLNALGLEIRQEHADIVQRLVESEEGPCQESKGEPEEESSVSDDPADERSPA